MTIGALSFLYPWILLGLLALPVIWWLLRVTPPQPQRIAFPPLALLLGLQKKEEESAHTPLWLLMLRLLIVSLLIVAFAGPLLNRGKPIEGTGPIVFVIDNGWSSATGWQNRVDAVNELLVYAGQSNRPIYLVPTADLPRGNTPISALSPEQAIEKLKGLVPNPWWPDRDGVVASLQQAEIDTAQIFWVSDNLSYEGDDDFVEALQELGALTIFVAPEDPIVLARKNSQDAALRVSVMRPRAGDQRGGELAVAAADGAVIGYFPFAFEPNATETDVHIDLPLKLRNSVGRISVRGQASAGATVLLDDSQQRRSVGIVASSDQEDEQPLLSDVYYLRRAIDPYAEIVDGTLKEVLTKDISVLVLSDVGQIVGNDLQSVQDWVRNGGVLIRFAGPRLAAKRDNLIPVNLREGGRAFGGALSWESPQKLKPFDPSSPFYGIPIGDDVEVRRQVLAEPSIELSSRTWAQLEDGTPLVTAAQNGDGWIILVHVTANSNWSNLPLSGMFVGMLRKMINISAATMPAVTQGSGPNERVVGTENALPPVRTLDGFGVAQDPPSHVLPLRTQAIPEIDSSHPPGIYGRRTLRVALNIGDSVEALTPIGTPGGVTVEPLKPPEVVRLQHWLLASATGLLLLDWLAVILLFGGLQWRAMFRSRAATSTAAGAAISLLFVFSALWVGGSKAYADEVDDQTALAATLETHLAYVVTGNSDVDRMSEAGLMGLGRILASRTAVEPGDPIGVDLEKDELAFFPLLFWPIAEEQAPLSPEALAKVDAYMKNGGTILFDTRDQQKNILPQLSGAGGSGQKKLAELVGSLDIPPLMPLNEDHVLTKSFYLLNTFPGRWAGGRVWVEAENEATGTTQSSNDGVSSIIVGSNDWAAAWAQDESGRPIAAVVPGGARQRELAMRFGVNLVMYALTGNYKADSVHIPALLERLGQ